LSDKFQIRPRFNLESDKTPHEVLHKLKNVLTSDESDVTGWVSDRSAHVRVKKNQNIWSPQLTVYAEEMENGTELRCVIGPNSTIWTTIIFFYAIIGMGALFGLMWGMSQMTLGQSPTAFWWVPVSLVLSSGVYFAARVGQKLSAEQMIILRGFIINLAESKSSPPFNK
jgi:hypothetical protein